MNKIMGGLILVLGGVLAPGSTLFSQATDDGKAVAVSTRASPSPGHKPSGGSHSRKARLTTNKGFLNNPPEPVSKYQDPADLLELIPVVRDINRLIPRRFSLVNHQVQLISDRLIIEHHFLDTRTRTAPKNSVISLSYSGGWGSELQGNLDVPLFYSGDSIFYKSGWARYPMGNYTMTINRGLFNEESFYIKARTKF